MPTEWPAQIVIVEVTMNKATTSHEKVRGAPMTAMMVMADVQIDFFGTHTTLPVTAELSGVEIILSVEIVAMAFPFTTVSEFSN